MMHSRYACLCLAALTAAAPPVPISSPPKPSLSLYPERFYRGPPMLLTSPIDRIAMEEVPRSIKTVGRWQICSQPQLRGDCIEVEGNYPVEAGLGVKFAVLSARPVGVGIGAGVTAPGTMPGGVTLGGIASRYWPAPTYGEERVVACPDTKASNNCAHDSAEDLCRRAGYRRAEHWQLENIGGRLMLADVLCVKGAWGVTR